MYCSFYSFKITTSCRNLSVSFFRLSLSLLVFLFSNNAFAQRDFSTTQLLSKNISTNGRALLQENLQYLKEENQKMPLVDEMSFRTETDELDASRQEYLFRMNFNNKSARDVQNRITNSTIQSYELKDQILRERELIKRYEYITKWYFSDSELEWYDQKRIILEDKKTIYKKMMRNAQQLNIDGLLKTEEDLQELDQELLELNHERVFSISQLFPETENSETYQLQASNWITVETMREVLEKLDAAQDPTIEESIQQNDIDLAKLDYDMEVAETEKVFDFVQLKYAGRNNASPFREFSLGMSLIIPTKSSNRVNINEAQLEIFDELYQQERLRLEIEEDLITAYAEFDHLMDEYQLIQDHIAKNKLEDTYEKYLQNGTVHPLTLLRIKESILKSERELQKIEKSATLTFIDILTIKGLLGKSPVVNYLSNDLESF
ncbi:MAG: hypothetical protein AB8F74_02125 [Saprospiraceae bacterium]